MGIPDKPAEPEHENFPSCRWGYNSFSPTQKRQQNNGIPGGLSPFSQGSFPDFPIPLKGIFSGK
jgi:hypothetical protein